MSVRFFTIFSTKIVMLLLCSIAPGINHKNSRKKTTLHLIFAVLFTWLVSLSIRLGYFYGTPSTADAANDNSKKEITLRICSRGLRALLISLPPSRTPRKG